MTAIVKKFQIREQLTLISMEAYLLLRQEESSERIKRYHMIQQRIDALLELTREEDINKEPINCRLYS